MTAIEIIQKYRGQTLQLAKVDCLRMVMDYLDNPFPMTFKYRTVEGGYKALNNALNTVGCAYSDYVKQVDATHVTTGDIVVSRDRHCYIAFGDKLFGVYGDTFQLKQITLPLDKSTVVYRKRK